MNVPSLVRLLRPHQWLKNLMLYFPPFLSGAITEPGLAIHGILPFFAFCMGSSATYIFNDIIDCEHDRNHPVKQHRPIPSGEVTLKTAAIWAFCLFFVSLWIAVFSSSGWFVLCLGLYLLISCIYTLKLKNIALIDIFCIATCFLLRLEAGGEAFAITISAWLFITVFLLALFLSIGKRLTEKRSLGTAADLHRKSLQSYPDGFLEGAMNLTGGSVLVTYSIYTISRSQLFLTVPLCCFGLLRYIMRVKSGLNGDPTESLLKDLPLLLVSLAWALIVGWRLYFA
ncbi:decaprenyl-phosphate phosphoribosyltransferase [Geotalea uraniireducens]|uniref:decaprenyl-phosphate phosphoribosyltransferase n=1 Tax=Geotalea uraniireducens TaxID=351604 RepID=UPI0024913281|nr:decaprenyl-phosphate phosphoribosyltransferase [Geotalea uraniireducens]